MRRYYGVYTKKALCPNPDFVYGQMVRHSAFAVSKVNLYNFYFFVKLICLIALQKDCFYYDPF